MASYLDKDGLQRYHNGIKERLANYLPKSLTSVKGDMIYASAENTPDRKSVV